MKHKRDFKALEKRRLKGAKLLARGVSKSEVARQLGVTRQTVAAWEQRLDEGGQDSLKRGALGRPRQLDAEQERELAKRLMAGAIAKPLVPLLEEGDVSAIHCKSSVDCESPKHLCS